MPTVRMASRLSPAPMRKRVSTRARLAARATRWPAPCSAGTQVTRAAMARKPAMNQGFFTGGASATASWLRLAWIIPMPMVTGTIQRARASFTVVATSRACLP